MFLKRSILLFLPLLIFHSPSDSYAWLFSSSKKTRLEGEWNRGKITFKFQKGLMLITYNNSVYATYEFVDKDTIRVKRDKRDTHWDYLVLVEFPSDTEMVWYLTVGGTIREWFRFTK